MGCGPFLLKDLAGLFWPGQKRAHVAGTVIFTLSADFSGSDLGHSPGSRFQKSIYSFRHAFAPEPSQSAKGATASVGQFGRVRHGVHLLSSLS